MPLSKKEYDRLRYIEKRELKLQQVKDYYQNNKDKVQTYQKVYNIENSEKVKKRQCEYQKKEYIKDPEKFRIRSDKWKEENPEKYQSYLDSDLYKKQNRIRGWRFQGIICDDYELIYRNYLDTNNCDFCHKIFKNSLDRQLDHNHSITESYNIRGILCFQCNINDKLKDYPIKEYPLD